MHPARELACTKRLFSEPSDQGRDLRGIEIE
jgi:hypothetical protein